MLLIALATLTATAVTVSGASGKAPPQAPSSGLQELWSKFPLTTQPVAGGFATQRVTTTTQLRIKKEHAAGAPLAQPHSDGAKRRGWRTHRWSIATMVLLGLFGVASFAVLVVGTWSNEGGSGMPDFLRPRTRRHDEDVEEQNDETEWLSTAPGIYLTATDAELAGVDAREPSAGATPTPLSKPAAPDLAQVGEHVASVLAAAEDAAQKLRADAERAANEAREEAGRAAAEIRTEATEEAETERASARRVVEEAEVSSKEITAEAEKYADTRRREVDAQAAHIVRDAEHRAAALDSTTDERHRVLQAKITGCEALLRELAESMRAVASSVDGVLANTAAHESRAEDERDDDRADSLEESLQAPIRAGARAKRPEGAAKR